MTEGPADVIRQLLKDTRLTSAQVDDRLQRARSREYWIELAPGLNVDASGEEPPEPVVPDEDVSAAARALDTDGSTRLRGAVGPATIERLNRAMDRIVAAGWPPVFLFVYDETWLCTRSKAVLDTVAPVVGAHPWQTPSIWVHSVSPAVGASGWPPHYDGLGRARVNCWIALTDAALENGCIHLVGRRSAPADLAERISRKEELTSKEVLQVLHGVRALPAAAGDLLAWTFDVIHWGGFVRRADLPARRSLAVEFAATDEPPRDTERPALSVDDPLPPLPLRLDAIARGLLRYRKFEPMLSRFEDLAHAILEAGA